MSRRERWKTTTPQWTSCSSRTPHTPPPHLRVHSSRTARVGRIPDALLGSGAAAAAPQGPHHDAELQDLRRQLSYKSAEATNLRTNLAAVQSELAAAKIAAARGSVGGGGRQDDEASRLRREVLQLRTKLEFAEQARREMQHAPAAVHAPQCRTTAAQTDAEHLGALPALSSHVWPHHFSSGSRGLGPCRFAAKFAQVRGLRLRLRPAPAQQPVAHPSNRAPQKVSRARSASASLVVRMKSWNSGWDSVHATWMDQLVIVISSIRCYLPPGLQCIRVSVDLSLLADVAARRATYTCSASCWLATAVHFWRSLGLEATKREPLDLRRMLVLKPQLLAPGCLARSSFLPSACMAVSARSSLETLIRAV